MKMKYLMRTSRVWLAVIVAAVSTTPGRLTAQPQMPGDEATAATQNYKIAKTELGKETIDGHVTKKTKMVITDSKGVKQEAITWNSADLKGFPVQVQMTEKGTTVLMRYRNVNLNKP